MLSPTNLVYFAEEQYQQLWFPAYGLLPRWHHARTIKSEKPAGLESLTLTFYQDHSEHRVIAGIMQQILGQVTGHAGNQRNQLDQVGMKERWRAVSLNSATYAAADFACRALVRGAAAPTLYSESTRSRRRPLAQWRSTWRTGASNSSPVRAMVPLIHHSLIIRDNAVCAACVWMPRLVRFLIGIIPPGSMISGR
ncbi:hypothetical protein ACNKHT_00465 [Shigella flexneri]